MFELDPADDTPKPNRAKQRARPRRDHRVGTGYADPDAPTQIANGLSTIIVNVCCSRSTYEYAPPSGEITARICKSRDCARRRRSDDDLRLRLGREPRVADRHNNDLHLSVQVVFRCLIHGQQSKVHDDDRLRVQRRHTALHDRSANGERRCDRHGQDSLYSPRSLGQHQRRHGRKWAMLSRTLVR
jgi:hypothetical protein